MVKPYPTDDDLIVIAGRILDDPVLRNALASAGISGHLSAEDAKRLREFSVKLAADLGYIPNYSSDYFLSPAYALIRRILAGKIQGVNSSEAYAFISRSSVQVGKHTSAHVREVEIVFNEIVRNPEEMEILRKISFLENNQQTEDREIQLHEYKEKYKNFLSEVDMRYGLVGIRASSDATALARMLLDGKIRSFEDEETQRVLQIRAEGFRPSVTFVGDSNV